MRSPLPNAALEPRPLAARTKPRSLIDLSLDPAQRAAALRPPGGAMLVLGEAGHGKTTVALHRLAHLHESATRGFRAVVIVPSEGLRRLLERLLIRLGVDVKVMTYDAWAVSQARRAFGDVPRRLSQNASVGVARIKRDPAVRAVLEEMATRPPGIIDDDEDAPPPATLARAHRGDLQHLFGDRALVERIRAASRQGIPAHAVAEVLEHTRIQFSPTTEDAHAHLDADRLVTVDAFSLDHGTPDEDGQSVDVEDIAVLFELDRLRALHERSKATRPRSFDCIVVDEAQELAPLELALIGRSLAPAGTLVVAGDADQQIDARNCFAGWEATMGELGVADYASVVLEVGYRCPAEVVAFARAVRDGGAGVAPEARIPRVHVASLQELAAWIAREGTRLDELDGGATKCVVTRTPQLARALAGALGGAIPRRLVFDGAFVSHRGVDVTTLDQVRGLEFDYVIVADVTSRDYPDAPASRRALYVAATRARHQLALACIGEPSPLVSF